jgi:hypothetical protein
MLRGLADVTGQSSRPLYGGRVQADMRWSRWSL